MNTLADELQEECEEGVVMEASLGQLMRSRQTIPQASFTRVSVYSCQDDNDEDVNPTFIFL